MERGAVSEAHFRSQTLPLAQPTLQDPVQTTWQVAAVQPMLLLAPTVKLQVAPLVQPRLALAPAVTVQVLPPLQVPLHELAQLPLHVPVMHASEQLATDGSQPILLNELPPHAAKTSIAATARMGFTGALLFVILLRGILFLRSPWRAGTTRRHFPVTPQAAHAGARIHSHPGGSALAPTAQELRGINLAGVSRSGALHTRQTTRGWG